MNYLTVENLTKSYGERVLFEDITFHINQGDKVALVAKNGTGKSSLLRLLTGEEVADAGTIRIHKDVNTGFLYQDPKLFEEQTVFEAVYHSKNPVMQAMAAYERSLKHPEDQDAMQQALSAMDRLQAWDYEVKVKQILSKLSITDMEQRVGELSGGQKKRVALAKLLIDEPDFIILDEPTNHLDLDMIEWLENYLTTARMTIFMVTHDRYFLDAVCTEIIEIDEQQIFRYRGNYSYYLEKKAERQQNMATVTSRAQSLYKKELDWMRRQPKARGTKAKARIDKFFEIEKKAKRNVEEEGLQLDIKMQRLGSKIIELHQVQKSYGKKVLLNGFSYKFKKRDRVGIVGRNGAGKTTLLNMITGRETPDGGKVVIGETVAIGYYTQDFLNIKDEKRVIDVVRDIADYIPMHGGKKLYAASLLERFLFDRKKQQDYVFKLSGGERRRLHLLTILIQNPNFLILDEPTNDLDLITLQVLEEFLMDYPGCVLIVSHDRHFMDKIVEHTFVLEGDGEVRDFPGNYSEYRVVKKREDQEAKALEKAQQKPKKVVKAQPNKAQRNALRRIEKELEKLEQKKEKILAQFETGALSGEETNTLSQELGTLNEAIEEKEMEWMELADEI